MSDALFTNDVLSDALFTNDVLSDVMSDALVESSSPGAPSPCLTDCPAAVGVMQGQATPALAPALAVILRHIVQCSLLCRGRQSEHWHQR